MAKQKQKLPEAAKPYQFKPGVQSKPPGTKNGRARALGILDQLLSMPGNQTRLRNALQTELVLNATKFFRTYVMPLIPREQLVKLDEVERAPIRILIGNEKAPKATTPPPSQENADEL